MKLIPLPAFQDNYLWLLHDGQRALVVDPGDAQPGARLPAARRPATGRDSSHAPPRRPHRRRRRPARRHRRARSSARRASASRSRCTRLAEGDAHRGAGPALRGARRARPHRRPHRLLLPPTSTARPLCSAATRCFPAAAAGCSKARRRRCWHSLDKLAALPGDTRVCCTHEYTLGNLKFAAAVEPGNAELIHYTATMRGTARAQAQPTLPSTHRAGERQINPFLRTRAAGRGAGRARARRARTRADEVAVFAALRQWKNEFR